MSKSFIELDQAVVTSAMGYTNMLNSPIEDDTVFVLLPLDLEEGETAGENELFKYASEDDILAFRPYNLNKFTFGGKTIQQYGRKPKGKKDIRLVLAEQFKVLSSSPLKPKIGTDKIYPRNLYTGYDDFVIAFDELKKKNKKLRYAPKHLVKTLKATDLIDGVEDRYLRTLELDRPIVYYVDKAGKTVS